MTTPIFSPCGGTPDPDNHYVFEDRASLAAADVDASVPRVLVLTYDHNFITRGGGAFYDRLSSAPSPAKPWHVQSADGAWWEVSRNSQTVEPAMYGYPGTEITIGRDDPWMQIIADANNGTTINLQDGYDDGVTDNSYTAPNNTPIRIRATKRLDIIAVNPGLVDINCRFDPMDVARLRFEGIHFVQRNTGPNGDIFQPHQGELELFNCTGFSDNTRTGAGRITNGKGNCIVTVDTGGTGQADDDTRDCLYDWSQSSAVPFLLEENAQLFFRAGKKSGETWRHQIVVKSGSAANACVYVLNGRFYVRNVRLIGSGAGDLRNGLRMVRGTLGFGHTHPSPAADNPGTLLTFREKGFVYKHSDGTVESGISGYWQGMMIGGNAKIDWGADDVDPETGEEHTVLVSFYIRDCLRGIRFDSGEMVQLPNSLQFPGTTTPIFYPDAKIKDWYGDTVGIGLIGRIDVTASGTATLFQTRRTIRCDATLGAIVYDLPNTLEGDWIEVLKTDASTNTVTVRNAAATTLVTLTVQHDRAKLVWWTGGWRINDASPTVSAVPAPYILNTDYTQNYRALGFDPAASTGFAAKLKSAMAAGYLVDFGNQKFTLDASAEQVIPAFSQPRNFGLKNVIIEAPTLDSAAYLIDLQGTEGSPVSASAPFGVGTAYLDSAPVADTSTLAVGQMVLVKSADDWSDLAGGDGEKRSEFRRIVGIDTNTEVHFDGPLKTTYTTTPTITPIDTTALPTFENVEIIGGGVTKTNIRGALRLEAFTRATWDLLRIRDTYNRGLVLARCPEVLGGRFWPANINSSLGYGLRAGGVTGNLGDVIGSQVRHVVTATADEGALSDDLVVELVQGHGGEDAILDSHRGVRQLTVKHVQGDVQQSGSGDLILVQGPNVTLLSANVRGGTTNGIRINYAGGYDVDGRVIYKFGPCTVRSANNYALQIANIAADAARIIDRVEIHGGSYEADQGWLLNANNGPIGEVVAVGSEIRATSTDANGVIEITQLGSYDFDAFRGTGLTVKANGTNHATVRARRTGTTKHGRIFLNQPRLIDGTFGLILQGFSFAMAGFAELENQSSGRVSSAIAVVSVGTTPCAVNDILTLSGGTFTSAATIKVTAVNGSNLPTAAIIETAGEYTVLPTLPAAVDEIDATFRVQFEGDPVAGTWSLV